MEHDLAAKTSHESFHSTRSQLEEAPTTNPPADLVMTDLHTAALQAAGLPVYDLDTFLNDPRNQASPEAKSPPQKKQRTDPAISSSSSAPEQLGSPKTTHNVPALHHLCQERGLIPEYEIDGDQALGFAGTVTVGGETIISDQRWRNKKEAKEGLAELAVPVVREIGPMQKGKAVLMTPKENREPEKNWVGMLLGESIPISTTISQPSLRYNFLPLIADSVPEYHNATDPTHLNPASTYTEYALGPSFACTCTIPPIGNVSSTPAVLGSPTAPFSTKKAARINAAKAAVQHLISLGELNPDGSCKAKKKAKFSAGPTVKVEAKGIEVKKDTSYANRVGSCFQAHLLEPFLLLKFCFHDLRDMIYIYGIYPNLQNSLCPNPRLKTLLLLLPSSCSPPSSPTRKELTPHKPNPGQRPRPPPLLHGPRLPLHPHLRRRTKHAVRRRVFHRRRALSSELEGWGRGSKERVWEEERQGGVCEGGVGGVEGRGEGEGGGV